MMPVEQASDIPWRSGLLMVAGMAGASGVILAALSAHIRQSAMLETSAYFLLIHAVAVVALATLSGQTARQTAWLTVATAMMAGALLFSSDLAIYALRRAHLFALAAPTGGTLLILAWLGVSVIAAIELAFPRRGVDVAPSESRLTDA
jgi:uncharacterized membrane protein YgdD (TMEM256/DUF423 family)